MVPAFLLRLLFSTSGCSREIFGLCFVALSFFTFAAQGAELPLSIPVQITHAQNFDPSPSPNGNRLVYISMISGKEQLFTMNVDGSNGVHSHVTMPIMKIRRGRPTGRGSPLS